MKAVSLMWDPERDPGTTLHLDGDLLDLEGARRVVVVVDVAYVDPVVDISYGTPLPIVLAETDALPLQASPAITPEEFLAAIDLQTLKDEVLDNLGGFDGDDPITATLKTLRRWASHGGS